MKRSPSASKRTEPTEPSVAGTHLAVLVASAVLFFAVLTAWHNSFSVPMLLDDSFAITANGSIKKLWPIWPVLEPPGHATTVGRPALNLTFAINYALGGERVQGYHAFSVIAHVLAGMTLLGVVRRTLLLPNLRPRFGPAAFPLAFFVALLWLLHPLQTQSITYISQRAEAIMGLCYFLTLYGLIRGATSASPGWSYGLALSACAFGMASKEAMVTAPVVVLIFDRVFLAGSFRELWRQRRWFYVGLAGTWLVLAYCMIILHPEYRGIGYKGDFTWWTYALTECRVVLQYLKLTIWPHTLVFDYGPEIGIKRVSEALPYAVLLGAVLAAIGAAWRRWPAGAFLGFWFFAILAPTSSVVPVVLQPMAENRVYLPLVAVVVLVVTGLYARIGGRSFIVFVVVAVGLGTLTVRRNRDYQSAVAIWTDTVAKRPQNSRAQINLANALADVPGRATDAIAHYEAALRIDSDSDEAHNNLGNILMTIPERVPDALRHYEAMVRLNPEMAEAHFNLGNALMNDPARLPDAIFHYEKAVQLKPGFADLNARLGMLLSNVPDRLTDAAAYYDKALKDNPGAWPLHFNLANVLGALPGRRAEAIAQYRTTLQLKPDMAWAHFNLGVLLGELPDQKMAAIASLETALRIKPDLEDAREHLLKLRASSAGVPRKSE